MATTRELASQPDLVASLAHVRALKRELLRREIIAKGRIDLLATAVLAYEVRAFHAAIVRNMSRKSRSLTVAPCRRATS